MIRVRINLVFTQSGLQEFGVKQQSGFYFDCEGPRHKAYVNPFAMAKGLVTNGDWLAFILDGGYNKPTLWLSDGWAWAQKQDWQSPLYWRKQGHDWYQFTLHGLQPLDMSAPVCHISFYEADAYAQWKGCRLPSEYEWELFARDLTIAGNFSENHIFTPQISDKPGDMQLYGDVWEWTRSPYTPYPGYQIPEGAVGEYNGKFMSGQYVLRGGSCVTPIEQMRATYRTFFYPHQRWQFMGLRLAKDC
ncbi:SUMF1/EgtB/PvdO family nonheme iron enzyme [Paraglaciecola aquimarina]|uniref:SUMF1/EgtB/PvdO family nonheme iron enzyme n=1 Tax=Paraglaciecola aquimarina TaxID=1235557 RepID=A0ABU3SYD8_9ALTE|nr:SUMF1/EgtB/PvdO family nonheme iron enzyme [Paraglaciecola aquimarina]MDU0355030.1 SUMF1/EgtB/PvdO family nonheme iron enzyme [Paraglaciecola aquimarina]